MNKEKSGNNDRVRQYKVSLYREEFSDLFKQQDGLFCKPSEREQTEVCFVFALYSLLFCTRIDFLLVGMLY